jgi:hypothetical protein
MALLCWLLFRAFPEREDFDKMKSSKIEHIVQELSEEKEFMFQC